LRSLGTKKNKNVIVIDNVLEIFNWQCDCK